MSGEDVYDVAKKAEEWEVGECPLCQLPYTRCDCPDGAEDEIIEARYRKARYRKARQ